MSSILKALKKLEEEKALHQENSRINVSRDILKEKPTGRKMIFWLAIAGIIALAVIATLTTLLLVKTPLPEVVKTTPAPILPTVDTVLLPAGAAVVQKPPVSSSGGKAVSLPLLPTEETYRQPGRPELQPPPQPAADKRMRTEMPDSHTVSVDAPQPESGRKPVQPLAPEQADISLTLSGIAWNKDSADRLAIINGQPAAIGTTVSGVVVEEIMPDRVKVNSAGRSFEIFLGKPQKPN